MKELIITIIVLAMLTLSHAVAAEDNNMIHMPDLKEHVIVPTLEAMESEFPGASNPAAVNLLVGIASHESRWGKDTRLKQVSGPALGIYQIELETYIDLCEHYLAFHKAKADVIYSGYPNHNWDGPALKITLIGNLPYQTMVARAQIYRQTFEWPADPNDIPALAHLWKDHWNTHLGKGTVDQFIDHFPREVLS